MSCATLTLSTTLMKTDVYATDVVWPELKQSGLIDSVLRNYYIPPVIFGMCDWANVNGDEIAH